MKKIVLAVAILGIIFCSFSSSSAEENETASLWIIKGTYDYFYVDTESSSIGFPIAGFPDLQVEADVNGEMHGGTLYLGRMLGTTTAPRVFMLEASFRNGKFNEKTSTEVFTPPVKSKLNLDVDYEIDVIDLRVTHQWVFKKLQPYIGAGYIQQEVNIDGDIKIDIPPVNGHFDTEGTLDAALLGCGLGVNLFSIEAVNFSTKGEIYGLYGQLDDPNDNRNARGYTGKVTGIVNYPLSFIKGSLFLDLGYQFQYYEVHNYDLTMKGMYGRTGISFFF
jgi:hypothetical protein